MFSEAKKKAKIGSISPTLSGSASISYEKKNRSLMSSKQLLITITDISNVAYK